MHQPCGLTVPSTVLQDEGGSNCTQFSQRCSPFGVSWYFTIFCETLAACAGVDVPMTAAAPVAPVQQFPRDIVIELPCQARKGVGAFGFGSVTGSAWRHLGAGNAFLVEFFSFGDEILWRSP